MSVEELNLDIAVNSLYMLVCTCVLPFVIIGTSFFYSGLSQRRSSLTMLALPVLLFPIVFLDWFIWGYSLCYSTSSNRFIGNLGFTVLRHLRTETLLVYSTPRGDILALSHFLFTGLFKVVCASLTFPCIAERGRILPMLVFLVLWSCIIYNPVTYWFWNKNGWLSVELNKLPVVDFAGGTCIHIVSGFTALAYSYSLGHRNPKILIDYRNSNTGYIVIGTFLIACGWCGFVSGCDYKFSTASLYIFANVVLSACSSGAVWMAFDYYFSAVPLENASENKMFEVHKLTAVLSRSSRNIRKNKMNSQSVFEKRKLSMISFSSGIIVGLVVFTPGGGFVSSPTEFWKAIVFGVVGAIICNISTALKYFLGIDDALDIFAIHGIAGIIGCLLTGLFANKEYGSQGGWVSHHWIQLGYQVLGCVVTAVYVFFLSCVLLYVIDCIPGLHLRIDKTFNKRVRENETQNNTEIESQADLEHKLHETQEYVNDYERLELLGSDYYEFGEYITDYVEFIKVLKPDDFSDHELESDDTQYNNIAHTSDFSLHPELDHNVIKRDTIA